MLGDMQCGGILHTYSAFGEIPTIPFLGEFPISPCKGNSHLPGCKGVIEAVPFAGDSPMPVFGVSHTD